MYLTGSGHREHCRTAVGARNQCRAAEDESVIQSSQERVPRYFAVCRFYYAMDIFDSASCVQKGKILENKKMARFV